MSKINLGWVVGVIACNLKFQHVDQVILMKTPKAGFSHTKGLISLLSLLCGHYVLVVV